MEVILAFKYCLINIRVLIYKIYYNIAENCILKKTFYIYNKLTLTKAK